MNAKATPKSSTSIFTGVAVAPGIGIGKAFVRRTGLGSLPVGKIADREADREVRRFHKAVENARKELTRLLDEFRKTEDPRAKEIDLLEGHRACLADPVFLSDVERGIREDKLNLEASLTRVVSNFARIFELVENTYLKERISDIREVASRILHALHPPSEAPPPLPTGPTVLVTEELRLVDLLTSEAKHYVGIVAEQGARTTHSTLMARSLGIPMVVGVAGACAAIAPGTDLLVDGSVGTVHPNPPIQVRREYEEVERAFQERGGEYSDLLKGPCTTADGVRIQLLASIANPSDLALLRTHPMDGVGLYRTEYPFLQGTELPAEDRLTTEYEEVASAGGEGPATLRLLNVGSSRGLAGRQLKREPNPALGRRSLRLLLADPDLLRLQVRAILRAAARGNVRILLPFASDLDDLRRARAQIAQTREELGREKGQPVPNVSVGVLVEIPGLVPMIPTVCREADFLTIGIDNLAQHLMVADRANSLVEDYLQMSEPGLIRVLKTILDRAGDSEVAAFGEMVRDPLYSQLLLGLGLRCFCLPPYSVPRVKSILLQTEIGEARAFAEEILALETKEEVRSRVVERAARLVTSPERT